MPEMDSLFLMKPSLIKPPTRQWTTQLFSEMFICFIHTFNLLSYDSSKKKIKLLGQELKSKLWCCGTHQEYKDWRSSWERSECKRDGQDYLGNVLVLPAHVQINKAQTVALDMNGVQLGTAQKTYCHKPRDSHPPNELEFLLRSSKDPKEKFYV